MYPKPPRPIGITVLSIFFVWIGGVGTLVFPVFIFAGTSRMIAQLCETQLHWSHALSVIAARLLCTFWFGAYVLYLFIGIGLWKLRRSALKAIIFVQWFGIGMGIITSLVVLRYQPSLALGLGVWFTGILGCFLWYLTRPAVRWPFEVIYAIEHSLTIPPPPPSSTMALWKKGSIGVGLVAIILTTFVTTLLATVEKSFRSSDIYKLSIKKLKIPLAS